MRTDNLQIKQGSTWGVIIPVLDPDGGPADLTGWSVRAQVRPSQAADEILHSWTTAGGNGTITDSNVILTVSAAESTAWPWRTGVYDVELVNGATVVRIVQGRLTVDPEVTR